MSKININDYVVFFSGGIKNTQSNGTKKYWERGDLVQVIDIDEDKNYWFPDGSWSPDLRGFLGVYSFSDLSDAFSFKANGYYMLLKNEKVEASKVVSKALSPDKALEACNQRYAVGMEILNMWGCRFTLKSMSFKVKDSGEVLTDCSKLSSQYTLYCPQKDEFANIISKPSTVTISEATILTDTAKRTFICGVRYRTQFGDVFTSNSEDRYTYVDGNVKVHKSATDYGLTVFTPQCGWAKEHESPIAINFHEAEDEKSAVKSRLEEAIKYIEETFKTGMSIRTSCGDEFDLEGNFHYVIDEDAQTVDLVDEDGDCFIVYDVDDNIYPVIIESPKPITWHNAFTETKTTVYTAAPKSNDVLDDLLGMLEVKSLIKK